MKAIHNNRAKGGKIRSNKAVQKHHLFSLPEGARRHSTTNQIPCNRFLLPKTCAPSSASSKVFNNFENFPPDLFKKNICFAGVARLIQWLPFIAVQSFFYKAASFSFLVKNAKALKIPFCTSRVIFSHLSVPAIYLAYVSTRHKSKAHKQ
jgi:hypothetical protein